MDSAQNYAVLIFLQAQILIVQEKWKVESSLDIQQSSVQMYLSHSAQL
jgi:hypothetical protein